MRKLASVQIVHDIVPIKGADKIELAKVEGFQAVIKKGEFHVGDKCIYIETDSICPDTKQFEFLGKNKRIRLMKLRGVISQGLVLPYTGDEPVGTDLTKQLGITKFELQDTTFNCSAKRGEFPVDIPKSDEIRAQNILDVLKEYKGTTCTYTEKLDGTSTTVYMESDGLHIASRNQDVQDSDTSTYWNTVKESNIPKLLEKYPRLCVQGELIGTGVQKNPYKLTTHKIYVFNIYNRDTNTYYTQKELENICNKFNIDTCPYLGTMIVTDDIDKLVVLSIGTSKIANTPREGIVCRPETNVEDYEHGFAGNRLSFKIINPQYVLKKEKAVSKKGDN